MPWRGGFIAREADTACTGPMPCAVVPLSAVMLVVPGSAGTVLGHSTGCSGCTPMGDTGGAETRCPSLVAEERQQLLPTRDKALREGCQEEWGERPGPRQLKTHSAVGKRQAGLSTAVTCNPAVHSWPFQPVFQALPAGEHLMAMLAKAALKNTA